MAFDFTTIKARETTQTKSLRGRAAREPKPNPWLDKTMPNGLWQSYEDGVPYGVDIPGKIEAVPYIKGKNVGELHDKPTGDAADAILLINDAATKLGIGVVVQTKPARNGFLHVSWQGQPRRKYTRKPKNVELADE